ncbi:class 1 isoprenoid biosynthesis enzyme [Proteiniborus sp. MB09-C3]|uniref:class 1 isoprenoid biosynthesis enzyme n=1 Tax=Proteiniborus sp. MB09-C3 TaxID=3050072 RepID=UPI0025574318|nr:class 1 isoprenoid biosynthesis enzyme [Proteiniborus sp. MB09-C3]WIV12685.1 class 1 isoprenoid biosynthesis enzyme [Proteiniborus sp. MB09-C3]
MEKKNGLANIIENLKLKYLSLWWKASTAFYFFEKEIKLTEKLRNERKIEDYRKRLFNELHKMPEEENKIKEWNNRIFSLIKDIEVGITGEEESYIDFFVEKGYSLITEEFIKEVRSFDTDMDVYDIFQAIRNVWIMNSIQVFFNMEVKLTPSIFSYSMLYPYSDNYLDDIEVTAKDKISFNNKFRRWLFGEEAEISNTNEEKVYQLVKKIEAEFPREIYNQVFESLLAIHKGQEKSLIQQRGESIPYERDIIGISFEKGGTSVLADGYLVKGELSAEEADFMFGYGVFLQIIDDLQDIEEDLSNGHMTILSQIAQKWPLDNLINKLLWFIEKTINNAKSFSSKDSMKLKKVIKKSCIIMIFEAISKNRKRFSKKYIKELEKYSILRFSYYKKLKRRFQKEFSSQDILHICTVLSKGYDSKKEEVI